MIDLSQINQELNGKAPIDIISWALTFANKPVVTTNFGPHEAVILHLCTQLQSDLPVIWIDSGYNTPPTYRFAEQLIDRLSLNIKIFQPAYSRGYIDAVLGGVPNISSPAHQDFTEQVKLEPFRRAMAAWQPDIWLTAIRKEQTAFRDKLDIVTQTPFGALRVAPLFHWSEAQLEEYLSKHDLPLEPDYYDPTKVEGHRECGLHPTFSA